MRHAGTRIRPAGAAACALAVAAALGALAKGAAPAGAQTAEWTAYAADQAGTKYSPLDQINAETVGDVQIVWRQPVIPDAIRNGNTTRGPVGSQTTQLMAGGRLYFSTGLGTIAALDPETGEVIWNTGPSDGVRVRQTRGVACYASGHSAGYDLAVIDELGLLAERHRPMVAGMRSSISAREGRFLSLTIHGPGPFVSEVLSRKGAAGLAIHHYVGDPDLPLDDPAKLATREPRTGDNQVGPIHEGRIRPSVGC